MTIGSEGVAPAAEVALLVFRSLPADVFGAALPVGLHL
jgi:hypothetical protein